MTHTTELKLDVEARTATVLRSDDPAVEVGKVVPFPPGREVDLLAIIAEVQCPPST